MFYPSQSYELPSVDKCGEFQLSLIYISPFWNSRKNRVISLWINKAESPEKTYHTIMSLENTWYLKSKPNLDPKLKESNFEGPQLWENSRKLMGLTLRQAKWLPYVWRRKIGDVFFSFYYSVFFGIAAALQLCR